MARYINPTIASEYPRVDPPKREYTDYVRQASYMNGVLIAVGDRGIWKVALVCNDEAEFEDIHSQYRQGLYLTLNFYAVPRDVVEANLQS